MNEEVKEFFKKYDSFSEEQLKQEVKRMVKEAKASGSYNRDEIIKALNTYSFLLGSERVKKISDILKSAED